LDGDSLGVDGSKVGVLEQRDEVCLGSLLQSSDGARLESPEKLVFGALGSRVVENSQIGLEVLSDFSD
jgi:hypothetical protein